MMFCQKEIRGKSKRKFGNAYEDTKLSAKYKHETTPITEVRQAPAVEN
jgi:hypothetical protein